MHRRKGDKTQTFRNPPPRVWMWVIVIEMCEVGVKLRVWLGIWLNNICIVYAGRIAVGASASIKDRRYNRSTILHPYCMPKINSHEGSWPVTSIFIVVPLFEHADDFKWRADIPQMKHVVVVIRLCRMR
jgi:hypothetical protein